MAEAPPSFQFYPTDFLVGTAAMSHSSKATFLLLLCYEWTHVDLCLDMKKLAVMVGRTEQEFAQDWQEVQHKFQIDEQGCLRNERLESIREKALALSEARKNAGSKGGSSKALAKLKQKGKQKVSKGRLKTEDRRLKNKQQIDSEFEQFWTVVETKVGKQRAERHYEKAVSTIADREADPHTYLRERMVAYQQSDRFNGEYAWEPCSWLRDGHYDDSDESWSSRSREKHDPRGTLAAGDRFVALMEGQE